MSDTSAADEVDGALAELALRAIDTLGTEMEYAPQSKDRIAAANSILDRLGYGRTTRAQADQADREIRRALEAVAKSAPKAIAQAQAQTEKSAPPADRKQFRINGETIIMPADYPDPPGAEDGDE